MSRILKNKNFSTVSLLILIFIFSACNRDEESFENNEMKNIRVSFSLAAEPFTDSSTGSRAGESESEATIDFSTLTVMAFKADGILSGIVRGNEMYEAEGTYEFELRDNNFGNGLLLVVLADWENLGLDLASVASYDDLRNISVSYSMDSSCLPLYGEIQAPISSEGNVEAGSIELKRAVAKIIVKDNLPDYEIVSASLLRYNSVLDVISPSSYRAAETENLSFKKDDGGDFLYAYVAPTELGDAMSDARNINLRVRKNGSATEESYTLWLKDYSAENGESGSIPSLQPNYLYTFNVTSLEESGEPAIEIQDKVRILVTWHNPTEIGGWFGREYINFWEEGKDIDPLIENLNKSFDRVNVVWSDEVEKLEYYCCDIQLSELKVDFENLRYEMCGVSSWRDDRYENSISLSKSARRIENREEDGKLMTWVWLTEPYEVPDKFNKLDEDDIIRLYWNKEWGIEVIYLYTQDNKEIEKYGEEDGRGFLYIDIPLEFIDPQGTLTYYYDYNRQSKSITLKANQLSIEKMNGKDYYVYYMTP